MKNLSVSKINLTAIVIVLIIFATSCGKSDTGVTNANFTGTYCGSIATGIFVEDDTITIPASSSSAIVMNSETGKGSSYSINGTVSGANITIASQSVFIPSLNANYNVTGSGTLTNSTLVIDYVFVSSGNTTTNWTFTGERL